ncbi:Ribokinase-like protein [Cantharellus anzutake]|uniref:Ribokinase-like protein n=1 Tax=Cantharellus anzutake TaxID=1750568 RepID=UPI0019061876|nr:Ribokinase-like protein [Cantharellus anzutake]KAF8311530.1 Ribokinase-like protein [Cantharellus anzutake]
MEDSYKEFVTLGMFIIDIFRYVDNEGNDIDQSQADNQVLGVLIMLRTKIGGGGTYCAVGARIWLPPPKIGMIVDRGHDFPSDVQRELDNYGEDIWLFRDNPTRRTTLAANIYCGNHRRFEYLTPGLQISPNDLTSTGLQFPSYLHFICSPQRASEILREIDAVPSWFPFIIYEPIPDRCIPEELSALKLVVERIDVLSPNAEEALSILSMHQLPRRETIEQAAQALLGLGAKAVIVRSGALGAYVIPGHGQSGHWVEAYFGAEDGQRINDVTGAGNAFLGGLAAGLSFCNGDLLEASFYATVSASYTIEQYGLPLLTSRTSSDGSKIELWNGENPFSRLKNVKDRFLSTSHHASVHG